MQRTTLNAVLALVLLIAGGCGSARTHVDRSPERLKAYSSASFKEDSHASSQVEDKYAAAFEKRLNDALYAHNRFTSGDDLVIIYSFEDVDPGSWAERFWLGWGAGAGSVTVHARYLDSTGHLLAEARHTGTVRGGFWGGSFSEAFQRAADELANYANEKLLSGDHGRTRRSRSGDDSDREVPRQRAGDPSASATRYE